LGKISDQHYFCLALQPKPSTTLLQCLVFKTRDPSFDYCFWRFNTQHGCLVCLHQLQKEQAQKIKNLMQNKSAEPQVTNDKPEPLSLAYAEEASGDFDVFATSEGTPIKLDLAQAYVNMGDIDNAKVILEDIIHQHRGKIVQSAQNMLKKITEGQ